MNRFLLFFCSFLFSTSASADSLSTYIVNGSDASVSTYSEFASLFYDARSYTGYYGTSAYCGATFLTDQYVMTAAHCLFEEDSSSLDEEYLLFTVIGQTDDESDFPYSLTTVRASEYYYPDGYTNDSSTLWQNDIAIIKLESSVSGSQTHANIVTDESYRDTSYSFTAVGHGITQTGEVSSSVTQLQSTGMTYVTQTNCVTSDSSLNDVSSSQICFTGDNVDTATSSDLINGVCSGDSGGPVYWTDSSLGYLVQVGVTSFGPSTCGQGTGTSKITAVFTEVGDYNTWIQNVISGSVTAKFVATDAKRAAFAASYGSLYYSGSSSSSTVTTTSSSGGSIGGQGLLVLALLYVIRRWFNNR